MTVAAGPTPLASALGHLRHEELELGVATLRELVAAEPDHADAWAYLSGALVALGRADEAREASARALELGPDLYAPHLKAAELAMRLGDPETGERHALAALRLTVSGSGAERAARGLLVMARTARRRGIERRAVLPSLAIGRRLRRIRTAVGQ